MFIKTLSLLKLLFVSLPIFVIGFVISLLVLQYRFESWMRLYRGIAARYLGRVESFGFRPSMSFDYSGHDVQVSNRKIRLQKRETATFFEVNLPEVNQRLQIVERSVSEFVRKMKQDKVLSTQDQAFDQLFECRTSESGRAIMSLPDSLRWQIRELKNRFSKQLIGCSIHKNRLAIYRTGYIRSEVELNDFIRMSLKIVDQFLLAKVAGIEFVNEDSATLCDGSLCPVCSEELRGEIVTCYSCKTPHCRDCWEYNGRCAMFACNETRYVRLGLSKVEKS